MEQAVLQSKISALGAMSSAILLPRRAFNGLVGRVEQLEAERRAELDKKLADMNVAERLRESLDSRPTDRVVQDMLTIQFYRIIHATDEHDPAYNLDDALLSYLDNEEGAAYHTFVMALRAKAHEDDLED